MRVQTFKVIHRNPNLPLRPRRLKRDAGHGGDLRRRILPSARRHLQKKPRGVARSRICRRGASKRREQMPPIWQRYTIEKFGALTGRLASRHSATVQTNRRIKTEPIRRRTQQTFETMLTPLTVARAPQPPRSVRTGFKRPLGAKPRQIQ